MTINTLSSKFMLFWGSFVLALSGCGKIDNQGTQVAAQSVGQSGSSSTCATGTTTVGKIYDASGSSQFETQVKGFVSATLDPQSLGTISGDINSSTGIDFSGAFTFDSSGNLVTASSSLLIKIFDSYVGQVYSGETVEPYVIEFSSASSGTINRSTGVFSVVFQDSYGSITFSGTVRNQQASGTVSYQNFTAVSGYSVSSGALGDFLIYTCALIK
ncbi:MAG: hypothetical protein AAGB31_01025 [Bdellovibrio sp.]